MARHACATCKFVGNLQRGGSADLPGTLMVLLRHATARLGVHAADVLLYDAADHSFAYAAGQGFRTRAFENSSTRILLASPVIQERGIIRNPDLTSMKSEWARSRELIDEGLVGYVAAPLIANEQIQGVLEIFHREALHPRSEWLESLEDIAEHGAAAIAQVLQVRRLQRANAQLADAYDATIESWARALELRDYEPKGHAERVAKMTVDFARVLKFSEDDLIQVRRGALLHDIGKLGIPDEIQLKPGSLSDAEWTIVQRHPVIAYEQLAPIEFLRSALDIPYCHHEKWDGTGYPRGLKGEEIPLAARIFAIVDVWDSLRSDRPFRKGWPVDKVLQHMLDRGSRQFDPSLADLFVKLMRNDKGLGMGFRTDSTPGSYLTIDFKG